MRALYKVRNGRNLRFQALDYVSLLYDRLSGITHIITEPAPQIIHALGDDCLDAKQIEAIMKCQFEMESDDGDVTFEDIITARLDEFVDLGLVERISNPKKVNNSNLVDRNTSL